VRRRLGLGAAQSAPAVSDWTGSLRRLGLDALAQDRSGASASSRETADSTAGRRESTAGASTRTFTMPMIDVEQPSVITASARLLYRQAGIAKYLLAGRPQAGSQVRQNAKPALSTDFAEPGGFP